jgi:integrase
MSRWKIMHERVEDYLITRRKLGYQLKVEGDELFRFARFADEHGNNKALTTEIMVAWANSSKKASDICPARRIETIRGLAKFCALFEPDTQIPPPGLLGSGHRRVAPHIYTEEELSDLMQAANKLNPQNGLRPVTMRYMIGLLSATGLRISEALRLNRSDVDLDNKLLLIRETKFYKSRYVPLHQTTADALVQYGHIRDRFTPVEAGANAFFLFDNGRSPNYRQALYAFQSIRRQLGWDKNNERLPRLHDLRHTFACNRLLLWYKQGIDVNNAILMLSVYLGHSKISDTYWYLTAIPSLMAIAAERFERFTLMEKEVKHA